MKLDEEVASTLRDIVVAGGPHFGEFQLALASLPVRMGGLGVFLPSDVASYAYAASLLSSMPLQNAILGVDSDLIPQFVRNLVRDFAETVFPSDPDQALEQYRETLQPHKKTPRNYGACLLRSETKGSSRSRLHHKTE
jgi:hypothetical protein